MIRCDALYHLSVISEERGRSWHTCNEWTTDADTHYVVATKAGKTDGWQHLIRSSALTADTQSSETNHNHVFFSYVTRFNTLITARTFHTLHTRTILRYSIPFWLCRIFVLSTNLPVHPYTITQTALDLVRQMFPETAPGQFCLCGLNYRNLDFSAHNSSFPLCSICAQYEIWLFQCN